MSQRFQMEHVCFEPNLSFSSSHAFEANMHHWQPLLHQWSLQLHSKWLSYEDFFLWLFPEHSQVCHFPWTWLIRVCSDQDCKEHGWINHNWAMLLPILAFLAGHYFPSWMIPCQIHNHPVQSADLNPPALWWLLAILQLVKPTFVVFFGCQLIYLPKSKVWTLLTCNHPHQFDL